MDMSLKCRYQNSWSRWKTSGMTFVERFSEKVFHTMWKTLWKDERRIVEDTEKFFDTNENLSFPPLVGKTWKSHGRLEIPC